MSLKIYTEPAEEPIELDDITRKHLRIDDELEDTLIAAYITAARRHAENFLGRALITQTWELFLDEFPATDYIELPMPPLQSVTHIQYKATDYGTTAALTTWAATNYVVDTRSVLPRISLAYGISWPTTYAEIQAVQIRYVCGYGLATLVPAHIKQAIMLKLADLYEHRGEGNMSGVSDAAFEAMLGSDRIVPV